MGTAVSMILVAATTEAKGKVFGIEFHKEKATPGLVKAVGELLVKVLPKLPGVTPF